DGGLLTRLPSGQRRGNVEHQQGAEGDQQPQTEGSQCDEHPTAPGELQSNTCTNIVLRGPGAMPPEGKNRGCIGRHVRTPVRSNLCATVGRTSTTRKTDLEQMFGFVSRAVLRWATSPRNREGPTDERRRTAR